MGCLLYFVWWFRYCLFRDWFLIDGYDCCLLVCLFAIVFGWYGFRIVLAVVVYFIWVGLYDCVIYLMVVCRVTWVLCCSWLLILLISVCVLVCCLFNLLFVSLEHWLIDFGWMRLCLLVYAYCLGLPCY